MAQFRQYKQMLRQAGSLFLLLLLVSFTTFMLVHYAGPDQVFERLGKHSSHEEIAQLQVTLGQGDAVIWQYLSYMKQVIQLNPGVSDMTGQPVASTLWRAFLTSLMVVLPGILLGQIIAVCMATVAVRYRGRPADRVISAVSMFVMSISFVITIIFFQMIFSSSDGFDLLPVTGWSTNGFADYMKHVSLPTMIIIFINMGYNQRFARSILEHETCKPYVSYARVYGVSEFSLLIRNVLPNCALPIAIRFLYGLPGTFIASSLLIENYFSIPGLGKLVFEAILFSDIPVLVPVIVLSALFFVLVQRLLNSWLNRLDPSVGQASSTSQVL